MALVSMLAATPALRITPVVMQMQATQGGPMAGTMPGPAVGGPGPATADSSILVQGGSLRT